MENIASYIDHTMLKADADENTIRRYCREAREQGFRSVCVNSYRTALVHEELEGSNVLTCTVVGFPLGAMSMEAKAFEAKKAVMDGASEIDMVINIGWLKDGKDDLVKEEIRALKEACGDHILKVIIETCLLTDDEKIRMCRIVTEAGADYIKTSTGFSKAGATFGDVELFASHVGPNVKIKAAGGIASLEDARCFLELGADRLGTSRIVKIVSARGTEI